MIGAWVFVACGVGFAIGGIAGIILGSVTGVALALVTYHTLTSKLNLHKYQLTTDITSIFVSGIAASLLILASGLLQSVGSGWGGGWGWLVWVIVPIFIAITAAWWAARRVTGWVAATPSNAG
jgi:hypothetical protein